MRTSYHLSEILILIRDYILALESAKKKYANTYEILESRNNKDKIEDIVLAKLESARNKLIGFGQDLPFALKIIVSGNNFIPSFNSKEFRVISIINRLYIYMLSIQYEIERKTEKRKKKGGVYHEGKIVAPIMINLMSAMDSIKRGVVKYYDYLWFSMGVHEKIISIKNQSFYGNLKIIYYDDVILNCLKRWQHWTQELPRIDITYTKPFFVIKNVREKAIIPKNILGVGLVLSNNQSSYYQLADVLKSTGRVKITAGLHQGKMIRDVYPLLLYKDFAKIRNSYFRYKDYFLEISWDFFNDPQKSLAYVNKFMGQNQIKNVVMPNVAQSSQVKEFIKFVDYLSGFDYGIVGTRVLREYKRFLNSCTISDFLALDKAKKIKLLFQIVLKSLFLGVNISVYLGRNTVPPVIQPIMDYNFAPLFPLEKNINLGLDNVMAIQQYGFPYFINWLFPEKNHWLNLLDRTYAEKQYEKIDIIINNPDAYWESCFLSKAGDNIGSLYFNGGRIRIRHDSGPTAECFNWKNLHCRRAFIIHFSDQDRLDDFFSSPNFVEFKSLEKLKDIYKRAGVYYYLNANTHKDYRLLEFGLRGDQIISWHFSRGMPSQMAFTESQTQILYCEAMESHYLIKKAKLENRREEEVMRQNKKIEKIFYQMIVENEEREGEKEFSDSDIFDFYKNLNLRILEPEYFDTLTTST